jgi:hypothetical protein
MLIMKTKLYIEYLLLFWDVHAYPMIKLSTKLILGARGSVVG